MERAYGLEIPESIEEVCHPNKMALLIYDLQIGIMSQLPEEKIVSKSKFYKYCRQLEMADLESSFVVICLCQKKRQGCFSYVRGWHGSAPIKSVKLIPGFYAMQMDFNSSQNYRLAKMRLSSTK